MHRQRQGDVELARATLNLNRVTNIFHRSHRSLPRARRELDESFLPEPEANAVSLVISWTVFIRDKRAALHWCISAKASCRALFPHETTRLHGVFVPAVNLAAGGSAWGYTGLS